MSDSFSGAEIAIVGLAGRYPKSKDLAQFWRNLHDGVEMIRCYTEEELLAQGMDAALVSDPRWVKAAPVLDDIDLFDASFFNFMPREAELLDPQHRLFLECAWEALETAGYDPERYDGLIGVYVGAGLNSYFLTHI